MAKISVSVVSPSGLSYSGEADMLVVNGGVGELGIVHGHAPLLTTLLPGSLRIINGDDEHSFYVSGGVLEVQKSVATVLAEVSVQASKLVEQEVIKAREAAKNLMQKKLSDMEYVKAKMELINATAQLAAIKKLRAKH